MSASDPDPDQPQFYTLVLKIRMDCNGCFKKVRRGLLNIHNIYSHWIDRKESTVKVEGSFDPDEMVKTIAKKTGRRVQVLDRYPSPTPP